MAVIMTEASLYEPPAEPDREITVHITEVETDTKPQQISSKEILDALHSFEDGDADLYIKLHRNKFCYDHSAGRWFEWQGNYWVDDLIDRAKFGVKAVIETYGQEVKRQTDLRLRATEKKQADTASKHKRTTADLFKRIKELQSSKKKDSILSLAKIGANSLGITGQEWDTHPMLLGFLRFDPIMKKLVFSFPVPCHHKP